MSRFARAFVGTTVFALTLSGVSCTTSSAKYVARIPDTRTTWGEITSLEGVSSAKLEETSDGVAVTLNDSAHVTLAFPEKPSRRMSLKAGDILVFGSGRDWVLEPFGEGTAVSEDGSPESPSDSDG